MASGPPLLPPDKIDPSPYDATPSSEGAGTYRWMAPATLARNQETAHAASDSYGGPGLAPIYELRPLSTGEVLDRTFSLYRSRFLLFAGIASLSAVVRLVGQAAQLLAQHWMLRRGNILTLGVTSGLLTLLMSAIFVLAFAITQAATVWAMGEVYLRRSATVKDSIRATAGRSLRYVGIALWQLGSAAWPALLVLLAFGGVWLLNGRSFSAIGSVAATGGLVFLLLAAMVAGLILYLRNLLAVPIAVREGLGVRASIRRSKTLSAGAKGKLFLVLLIAGALYMVMGILLATMVFILVIATRSSGGHLLLTEIVTLAVVFAGYTVISPVILIGITLVYFDQRVRKEAFDVAVLLGDESAPGDGSGRGTMAEPSLAEPPVAETPSAAPLLTKRGGVEAAAEPMAEPPGGASGL